MYGKNQYSGTEQTVAKSFEPSSDPDVINLVSQDFDFPLPDLLTLHLKETLSLFIRKDWVWSRINGLREIFGHRGDFPNVHP